MHECSIVLALHRISSMGYAIKDIVAILGNRGQIVSPEAKIEHLLTDSRNIAFADQSLFVAISGKQHDGHQYIQDAYTTGVRSFLVEKMPDSPLSDANFIQTSNSLQALQQLAAHHRSNYHLPVIGITGSNGKTIVKEWLYHLLKIDFDIVRSPKSYNSQLGVPLSIWAIDKQHELGIFEAGISLPGEMEVLEKIIQPNIGIFTNITNAHNEGFSDESQKIAEKLKLFPQADIIIYRKDYTSIDNALKNNNSVLSWSTDATKNPDILISDVETLIDKTLFTIHFLQQHFHFAIPFADAASFENAVHALITSLFIANSTNQLNDEMLNRITLQAQELPVVSMRLELKKGNNNSLLINDAYSADIASLDIALRFMHHHADDLTKTVIISDFDESGESDVQLYKKVAVLLKENGIKNVYAIGSALEKNKIIFSHFNSWFFNETQEFLKQINSLSFERQIILIKGARRFQLEKIGNQLALKTHGTVLRINMNNLAHNLNIYRAMLNPGVKTMAMVKAFSYGSGQAEIARLLANQRVDYLAVAYADEGADLRRQGIRLPIMVMNPEPETFDQLKQYQLEPEIYSIEILKAFIQSIGKDDASIHIKIDTGMHRLGFVENDIPELLVLLKSHQHIRVASIFSQLAGADENKHDNFSEHQITLFNKIASSIQTTLGYQPLRHILNSSGISRMPHAQFDMVRLGIGLYGVDPSAVLQNTLLPVGTLQTNIAQIHDVKQGESIGYSRSFIADKNMRIATINIGYADGFSRRMSNGKGMVWLHQKTAPIVGRVCMDMSMIDVTHIPETKIGDTVEIFGEYLSITDYAALQETIPYEVMTGISQRVKRIYEFE